MKSKTYTLAPCKVEFNTRTLYYILTYKGKTLWASKDTNSQADNMNATLDAYKFALTDGATHIKHSETGKISKL